MVPPGRPSSRVSPRGDKTLRRSKSRQTLKQAADKTAAYLRSNSPQLEAVELRVHPRRGIELHLCPREGSSLDESFLSRLVLELYARLPLYRGGHLVIAVGFATTDEPIRETKPEGNPDSQKDPFRYIEDSPAVLEVSDSTRLGFDHFDLLLRWPPKKAHLDDLRAAFQTLWRSATAPGIVVFAWELHHEARDPSRALAIDFDILKGLAPGLESGRLRHAVAALLAVLTLDSWTKATAPVRRASDVVEEFLTHEVSVEPVQHKQQFSSGADSAAVLPAAPGFSLDELAAHLATIRELDPSAREQLLQRIDGFLAQRVDGNPLDPAVMLGAFNDLRDILPPRVFVIIQRELVGRLGARLAPLAGTDLSNDEANRRLAASIEGVVRAYGGVILCSEHSRPAHLRVKARGPRAKEPRVDYCVTHEVRREATTCARSPGLPLLTISIRAT